MDDKIMAAGMAIGQSINTHAMIPMTGRLSFLKSVNSLNAVGISIFRDKPGMFPTSPLLYHLAKPFLFPAHPLTMEEFKFLPILHFP